MSSNLNFNEDSGKYAFMSKGEKAWHGCGQIVNSYLPSREVIKEAQLDFTVDIAHNVHRFPDGEEVISDSSFFTYRTDNKAILGGKLGPDYHVVQNIDAFSFFDSILGGKDGILYETAGALGNGERIFITAKLPTYIEVGRGDLIEKYIFLTTAHDGSASITAAFTPVRIVCANTLAAALRNMSNVVKIRHTENAAARLVEAHKIMGISDKISKSLDEIFNRWASIEITDKQVKKLIQIAMVPNKETMDKLRAEDFAGLSSRFNNTVDKVYAYAQSSPTQQMDTTRGTLFGAYNAVTGYFQNVCNFKNPEAKLDSILFGGSAQVKTQSAFDLCMGFAKSGADALILN